MTRDETVALFLECEAKRAVARAAALGVGKDEYEAEDIALEAAKAHWNAWAEPLLAERKAMEDGGRWAAEEDGRGSLQAKNAETQAWMDKATADFSRCFFFIQGAEGGKETAGEDKKEGQQTELPVTSIQLEGERADFYCFMFPASADFQSATFSCDAYFLRAAFSGGANFWSTTFSGEAEFVRATFSGGASFECATFSRGADFWGAAFSGEAEFVSATFSGDTSFECATFSGNAGFGSATFGGNANFCRAAFNRYADFKRAAFGGQAYFKSGVFSGHADFQSATFSGNAGFEGATVSGSTYFQSATFGGNTSFESAAFSRGTDFECVTFSGGANFRRAAFSGIAGFQNVTFKSNTALGEAKFKGEANFTGIKVECAFDMEGAEFWKVPAFSQADFKQAPDLDDVKFPRPGFWRKGDPALTPLYRALRRMAIQGSDYEREQMAFKGELRSRRWIFDKPWALGTWFGLFYDGLADCGRSMVRPLWLWGALVALFPAIYLVSADVPVRDWREPCAAAEMQKWERAASVSLSAGMPLIGGSRSEEAREFQACMGRPGTSVPLSLAVLQVGQSLLSTVLIFLLLLAVKNRFKIK